MSNTRIETQRHFRSGRIRDIDKVLSGIEAARSAGLAKLLTDRLVIRQVLVSMLVHKARGMCDCRIQGAARDAFPYGAKTDQVNRRDAVMDDLLALALPSRSWLGTLTPA
ncbi:hypothetical protein [Bradyrhizobium sp. BR 1433]|uniref:hypothetical protein n=1 Tax=Bradyrhizobium sp. BR 1433 TaxID=3447967 RepID=UPI003EE426B8